MLLTLGFGCGMGGAYAVATDINSLFAEAMANAPEGTPRPCMGGPWDLMGQAPRTAVVAACPRSQAPPRPALPLRQASLQNNNFHF